MFIKSSPTHPIVIDCPSDLPPLWGDEVKLLRALQNLISNAFKYSPQGSTVTLGAWIQEESLVLSIRDQRSGIPREVQDQIFSRFFRIDTKDGRTLGGTGLGLPLVQEIVKAHRGKVESGVRLPRLQVGVPGQACKVASRGYLCQLPNLEA